MKLSMFFLVFMILPTIANAQISASSGKDGEVLTKPICSYLHNRSDYTIQGTIATFPQTIESGDVVRHRNNFKLAAGDRKEICASGPFYAGQRLELTIRTLFPLFSCKTKIDRDVVMKVEEDFDGNKKYFAVCY